jgi:glycosyltransferase involved in cell wall biosynthesis
MRLGFISTFPPTKCGLASYTDSLTRHLSELGYPTAHVVQAREDEDTATIDLPPTQSHAFVVADLVAGNTDDHWRLNTQFEHCDAVVIQHEFGIFGGEDGEEVLSVIRSIKLPKIVVLHTVVPDPTARQLRIIEGISDLADQLVVMTGAAFSHLQNNYSVDLSKVTIIPHGVPTAQFTSNRTDQARPGQILTWGLMGPGKGIEWGIMALAIMKPVMANLHYRIIGQIHPKVFERDGDAYFRMLDTLARELGVRDSVSFENAYVPLDELATHIAEAEIVLLPYEARHQVTSGVLVEALAAAKPVVATQFPHAQELLNGDNGIVVPHDNPIAMARALETLMRPKERALARAASPDPLAPNSWPAVAEQFAAAARNHISAPALR